MKIFELVTWSVMSLCVTQFCNLRSPNLNWNTVKQLFSESQEKHSQIFLAFSPSCVISLIKKKRQVATNSINEHKSKRCESQNFRNNLLQKICEKLLPKQDLHLLFELFKSIYAWNTDLIEIRKTFGLLELEVLRKSHVYVYRFWLE